MTVVTALFPYLFLQGTEWTSTVTWATRAYLCQCLLHHSMKTKKPFLFICSYYYYYCTCKCKLKIKFIKIFFNMLQPLQPILIICQEAQTSICCHKRLKIILYGNFFFFSCLSPFGYHPLDFGSWAEFLVPPWHCY